MAFISHTDTLDSGDWLPLNNLSTSTFIIGKNWQVYRDALRARSGGYQDLRDVTVTAASDTIAFGSPHGYVDGQQVLVYSLSLSMPGNVNYGQAYYIRE